MTLKSLKNLEKQLSNLRRISVKTTALTVSIFILWGPAFSYDGTTNYPAATAPHPLQDLKIKENLGDSVDLSLPFTSSKGQVKSLKDYFNQKPALLTVVYYKCPSLCNFHLNGLFEGIKALEKGPLGRKAGKDYSLIVLSMDDRESPKLALEKKKTYLKTFGEREAYFLTGSKKSIQALTRQLGFAFRWDEDSGQFAHSPVAYALSPDGKISRYLHGVQFESQTLRLALAEAAQGKIKRIIDPVLLFCYRFDPEQNRYTLYAYNVMRAGAALTLLLLLSILLPVWLQKKKA